MNTYIKYCANVYVASCEEEHNKGDVITMTTKRGAEHDCIVHNFLGKGQKSGTYFYSVTRADGLNAQEYAKRRAERFEQYANNAAKRSYTALSAAQEGRDFLALGEPIKVGHHSEKRHRALFERNNNRMLKSIEEQEKSARLQDKAAYWASRENDINLSMPESIEFYAHKLEQLTAEHAELKANPKKRTHSYSLTYAKKAVTEAEKNLKIAQKLWG